MTDALLATGFALLAVAVGTAVALLLTLAPFVVAVELAERHAASRSSSIVSRSIVSGGAPGSKVMRCASSVPACRSAFRSKRPISCSPTSSGKT